MQELLYATTSGVSILVFIALILALIGPAIMFIGAIKTIIEIIQEKVKKNKNERSL